MINALQIKPSLMLTSGIQDAFNVNESKINRNHANNIKKYTRPPRHAKPKNIPVKACHNAIASNSIDIDNFESENIKIMEKKEKKNKVLKNKFNKIYNIKKKISKQFCIKKFKLKMYKLKKKISKTLKINNILKVNKDNRPKYVDNNNKLLYRVTDVNIFDSDGDNIREDPSIITNSRDNLDKESKSKLTGRANAELKDKDNHVSTNLKVKNIKTMTVIPRLTGKREFKDKNKNYMENSYRALSNFIDGNNSGSLYYVDYHNRDNNGYIEDSDMTEHIESAYENDNKVYMEKLCKTMDNTVHGDHGHVYKIVMKDNRSKVNVLGDMSNEKKVKNCHNGMSTTDESLDNNIKKHEDVNTSVLEDRSKNNTGIIIEKMTNEKEGKHNLIDSSMIDNGRCTFKVYEESYEYIRDKTTNMDKTFNKNDIVFDDKSESKECFNNAYSKESFVSDSKAADQTDNVNNEEINKNERSINPRKECDIQTVNENMDLGDFSNVEQYNYRNEGEHDTVSLDNSWNKDDNMVTENNELISMDMDNVGNIESLFEFECVDNKKDGCKSFDESSNVYIDHIEEKNESPFHNNGNINNEENENEVFPNAMTNKDYSDHVDRLTDEYSSQLEVKEERYIHIDEYSDVEVDGNGCRKFSIDINNKDDAVECLSKDIKEQFPADTHLSEIDCKVETEPSTGQSDNIVSGTILSINERKNKDPMSKGNDKSHIEAFKKKIVIPRGFCNPQGFCFLNSVVQMLRGSIDFHYNIIEYFKSKTINQYQIESKEKNFVKYFCILFNSLEEDNTESIENILHEVQRYFIESKNGDDVQKCFMSILTAINTVTKTVGTNTCTENDKVERSFINYRMKNQGFIFESFYGQMSNSTQCNKCKHKIFETFQLFKCLPLPVPQSKETITLEECIKCFLKESSTDVEEPLDCDCENGSTDISSFTKITHSPKYLFLYLTRGSYYTGGEKNRTFVDSEEIISVDTTRGLVKYRCISIIDHLGDNEYGHYYCKCNYEGQCWWLINDTQVTELGYSFTGIISRNTIAFMFVKVE